MQQLESTGTLTEKWNISYLPIIGVAFSAILLIYLWKPINPERVTYLPLVNNQITIEEVTLPISLGNASIELIEGRNDLAELESSDQPTPEDDIVKDELDEAIADDANHFTHIVERGDTLSSLLFQSGVSRSDIYLLTGQNKQLASLRIGQQISWTLDKDNILQSFSWVISNKNTRVYERIDNKFIERVETREGIWTPIIIKGSIGNSFVADARAMGLTSSEIATVTRSLQWQLDFRLLQKGDQFSVLLSREMFGDKHEGSTLSAVRIKNGSREYYAILADNGQFYDIKGSSLSRSFLRYPLDKPARISSQFNPRRFHPVTKQVQPHNGVDFAISRGTPVLAAGDGQVVISKYSGSAGNYIAIRHGRQYTTRYMHLDKLLVKPGQRVVRGQQIGLSGNTGRSTGPHLHYELHIDNKPVNPLTASLPLAEGLTGKSKIAYLDMVEKIKPQLTFLSEDVAQNNQVQALTTLSN